MDTEATARRPARWTRLIAMLGLGLTGVAVALVPVLQFGRGETATHARLHLGGSTVVLVVATAVALLWRGPYGRVEWRSRKALLFVLCYLAASQLAEACGALAWEADGETVRSPTLHVVHTVATVSSGTALVASALAAALAVAVLARRLLVTLARRLAPN